MRKLRFCAPMMTLFLLLTACGGGAGGDNDQLALDIRAKYLAMNGCSAKLELTADYGQRVYDYTLAMTYTRDEETVLTVESPERIAGITARITKDSASLEYDGVSLETGPLDDQGLSPVSAVPVLLTAAQEAFIAESAMEQLGESETLKVTYRDPEATPGTGREMSLWFDAATGAPLQGEVLSDGYQVIRCTFTEFMMT